MALIVGTRGGDYSSYEIDIEPESLRDEHVGSFFFTALENFVSNVRIHGWKNYYDKPHKAWIWVRKQDDVYRVRVGNTGQPLSQPDPFNTGSPHGLGTIRALLRKVGGNVRLVPSDEQMRDATCSSALKPDTVFEFTIPESQ